MKRTSSKKQRRSNNNTNGTSSSAASRMAWLSVALTLASQASAFHTPTHSSTCAMIETPSRRFSSDVYVTNANRGPQSPFGYTSRKSSSLQVATRLQYRDGDDESVSSNAKWWNGIFPTQPESTDDEQENVDQYLEFLDRRYKRLHSKEQQEETKGFSAINWLLQGSPKSEDTVATAQQEEDALYVLGVAGLASQKLLQKHHLLQDNASESSQSTHHADRFPIVDVEFENDSHSTIVIKRIVVPVLRFLFVAQRRKDMFLRAQSNRAKALLSITARSVLRSLIFGPAKAARGFLEIGGGKKTLAITAALVSTLLLLTRPVLKAAITEGSVSP